MNTFLTSWFSTYFKWTLVTVNIKLQTPKRANQKGYKLQSYIFRKSIKRIETLFSQLCDQFRIRNNYPKTFEGFKTRILAKITALTLVQYIVPALGEVAKFGTD